LANATIAEASPSAAPRGLYIHIPFCVRKCPYCDFFSTTDISLKNRFLNALQQEMAQAAAAAPPVDTVYIGGGTPSLLTADETTRMFTAMRRCFDIADTAEITIEVNPGTIDTAFLTACRRNGVNRINIGVQSFVPARLSFLERIHSAADAVNAILCSRKAGFERIGLDLIYGTPDQTAAGWRRELATALSYEPAHLSCYLLSYEKNTPFAKRSAEGTIAPLCEDTAAKLFDVTHSVLTQANYLHYEISNFARRCSASSISEKGVDNRSRHNCKYWSFTPYIGLGPAAHSFAAPVRWWNVPNIKRYIERLEKGRPPLQQRERLTQQQRMMEAVYLGLRQHTGIDTTAFTQRFAVDFRVLFGPAVDELMAQGFLTMSAGCCALTPQGMRFLDAVAGRLVAEL